jgi:hypothetical protein
MAGINYPEGGYDYPKHIAGKDSNFYYYPLKNTLSKRDSFRYVSECVFFRNFNEPNLSLRPMDKEEFRFVYSGWARKTYIILLREDTITIKSGNTGEFYEPNYTFTNIEKEHLELIQRQFPFDDPQKKPYVKHYLDSMVKAYPKLTDPKYYHELEDKSVIRTNKTFDSSKIPVKKEIFDSLVSLFNAAGFWKLPFEVNCEYHPMDGDGFILEANTKKKYQVVRAGGCPDDTTRLIKACQTLIEYAQLGNKIQLIWSGATKAVELTPEDIPLLQEIKPARHRKPHRSSSK